MYTPVNNVYLDSKLWDVFEDEYLEQHAENWDDFINSKNLGIHCNLKTTVDHKSQDYEYKLIDARRFTLTRLKYGV